MKQWFDLAIALFLVFAFYVCARLACGCVPLSKAEESAIANDAVHLSVCHLEASDCHKDGGTGSACWSSYDRCKARYGLLDGGTR